ncbi:MAG: biosynthetic arginine decarboxylase [Verrucomicrobiota bacterium]
MPSPNNHWKIQDAYDTYLIDRWGEGYFIVDDSGLLAAKPQKENGASIPLLDIITAAAQRGVKAPFVIRFHDILRHSVISINECFRAVIKEHHYQGQYRGVFPMKVNHMREVVEEIMDAGSDYHFGLEVGSKPELIAALAVHEDTRSLLICNGYKDEEFIRLALNGSQLGKRVILVVEKLEELRQILSISEHHSIQPCIGIRIRLNTKGEGKWSQSGGDDSKFGLNTAELLEATKLLRKHSLEDSLQLLHFHVGSQISNISKVGKAVREISRYYCKLCHLDFNVRYIDVGGGLAVDYDGSRSATESSMNYTVREYASTVVNAIQEVCDEESVPHPDIVSESGRAIVAHHSVLIVESFDSVSKNCHGTVPLQKADHKLVHDIAGVARNLTDSSCRETLHEANRIKAEAESRFNLGLLNLDDKAKVETWYWSIAEKVCSLSEDEADLSELAELSNQLGDQYLCNFSIFQSLIDHWAVDQLFPIVPLQRLNEKPDNNASLVDITCDSDGKINRFVREGTRSSTLPVHQLNDSPYFLGVFLVGAYQDVMGDIHNLFGPLPETHIFLDENEACGFYIEEVVAGQTIDEVLSDVQYEPQQLTRLLKKQIDGAIKNGRVKANQGMEILFKYQEIMKQPTYLKLK